MVEGGWYFCPNEESADLASCAYCKLSLDGWEPKDNPFDEHYRRSSDCSFFVFAKPAKGKGSRSKKARTSKASRLSTQSTASEIPASDIEDQMDQSVLSQSTKTKSSKKSSKSKSKSAKTKKDEPQETASQMVVDEEEPVHPETSKLKRAKRGKKRSSADLDRDAVSVVDGDNEDLPEPPTKKRATKTRTSRARAQSIASTDGAVEAPEYESDATHEDEDRKASRETSKKKTSRGRKGSVTSSTSKNASKSRIPRDSELEAAIEAGLEADEPQNIEPEEVSSEKTTSKSASKKPKSKKKNSKKDPEPSNDEYVPVDEAHAVTASDPDEQIMELDEAVEQQEPKPTEAKGKRRSSKKTVDQPQAEEIATVEEQPQTQEIEEDDHRHRESFVSVEIISKPPVEYSEVKTNDKDSKKAKKKSSEKTKKSKKADKAEKAEKPETAETKSEGRHSKALETPEEPLPRVSRTRTPEPTKHEQIEDESSRRRSSKVPPKTAERYSDIPHEKQYAKSFVESDRSPKYPRLPDKQSHDDGVVSPIPSMSRGSPSLSPQSSDAENHPPSLKASAPRTRLSSPSKPAAVRFPLASSTPSPSKRNASAGKLQTSHPWIPINVEEILLASASDKENVGLQGALSNVKGELASPEKKMTVEEWIMWNAKNGEERLKRECERLVGQFEREGARAMRAIEGIECID
ncbi:hypothetical protein BDV12DRAFT_31875 [Aspergillus spectabilis]